MLNYQRVNPAFGPGRIPSAMWALQSIRRRQRGWQRQGKGHKVHDGGTNIGGSPVSFLFDLFVSVLCCPTNY